VSVMGHHNCSDEDGHNPCKKLVWRYMYCNIDCQEQQTDINPFNQKLK
jgi:hypothetical protein